LLHNSPPASRTPKGHQFSFQWNTHSWLWPMFNHPVLTSRDAHDRAHSARDNDRDSLMHAAI
jgi:hypothetical protein